MIIKNNPEHVSTDQIVLFPFDDYSIPFQHGVHLQLVPYRAGVDRTQIVVHPGPPGAPDSARVIYYGSIHRVGDELWMWYLGHGDDDSWHQRVCFAKSRDGYNWEKPELGLVAYNGSTRNNLVDIQGGQYHIQACVVYYEPDDPEPTRRFKAIIETSKYSPKFAVMFSEDGLQWHEAERHPNPPSCEMSGVTKFNGCYYLSAHGGSHIGPTRQMVMYASYDFEHWIEASCLGFRRGNIPPRPVAYGAHQGEQVHLGAALWNRGNVILGFYGQWHGPKNNDRRHVTMDLGLVVSNDALHYREPIPDFQMVEAAEDDFEHLPTPMNFKHAALMQGQGFENVGDETLFWYAPWPEQLSNGVRIATWKRDRLGYLSTADMRRKTEQLRHVISAPIDLEGQPCTVALNVDGLSAHSQVTLDILDERFQPIEGYTREDCLPLTSGFHQTVAWKNGERIDGRNGAIRIRLNYTGIRPEDPKVYAIYVEKSEGP